LSTRGRSPPTSRSISRTSLCTRCTMSHCISVKGLPHSACGGQRGRQPPAQNEMTQKHALTHISSARLLIHLALRWPEHGGHPPSHGKGGGHGQQPVVGAQAPDLHRSDNRQNRPRGEDKFSSRRGRPAAHASSEVCSPLPSSPSTMGASPLPLQLLPSLACLAAPPFASTRGAQTCPLCRRPPPLPT